MYLEDSLQSTLDNETLPTIMSLFGNNFVRCLFDSALFPEFATFARRECKPLILQVHTTTVPL